jgi:hypothetical protein
MFEAKHRAYVLRWARMHWREDHSQPADMDEMLERTATEITALADSRLMWRVFAFAELGIIGGLIWLLSR